MGCLPPVNLLDYREGLWLTKLSTISVCVMITGPISESDFFTWEALIVGPKDTPFVCAKALLRRIVN